ncbi:MAG: DUF4115 domain-containing protein [Limnochordaceae bacterium]|nr:DUF4115 domain-containing protein [Limnochordaceae bacterium]
MAPGGPLPVQGGAPDLPAVAPAPPQAALLEVVAIVQERCWMEVYVDGARQFYRTAEPGERLTWRADKGITIRLGNAAGVRLLVNGRPEVLPSGVVTRHFTPAMVPRREQASAVPRAGTPAGQEASQP